MEVEGRRVVLLPVASRFLLIARPWWEIAQDGGGEGYTFFTSLSFQHHCEPDSVTGAHTLPSPWEAPDFCPGKTALTAQPSTLAPCRAGGSGFPGQGGSDWQVAGPCPPLPPCQGVPSFLPKPHLHYYAQKKVPAARS